MNSDNCNALHGYKRCAGKGCSEPGIHHLKVLFINKSGWFCDKCKNSLVEDKLVDQNVNLND